MPESGLGVERLSVLIVEEQMEAPGEAEGGEMVIRVRMGAGNVGG